MEERKKKAIESYSWNPNRLHQKTFALAVWVGDGYPPMSSTRSDNENNRKPVSISNLAIYVHANAASNLSDDNREQCLSAYTTLYMSPKTCVRLLACLTAQLLIASQSRAYLTALVSVSWLSGMQIK